MLDFLAFLVDVLDTILFAAARKKAKDDPDAQPVQPTCLLSTGTMLFFSLFHVFVGTAVISLVIYVIVQNEKQLPVNPWLLALLIVLALALLLGIAANLRLLYLAKKKKREKDV